MLSSKALFAVGAAVLALSGMPAMAQDHPMPARLTLHKIASDVYWVEGGAANTGLVVGTTGVVAVDAEIAVPVAKMELIEVAKVTPKSVDTVIITHSDPDHVGGLPGFAPGTAIIEQENTRAAIIASATDPTAPPFLAGLYRNLATNFPATRLIGETEKVVIDGVRMELIYVAPGHSAGDLIVYLPDQKVVFAGDVVLTNEGRFPVIHIGGSSLGWIAAMRTILALKADVIVPGHGLPESRQQLADRLHETETRRATIEAMVLQGKTLDQINQALPETGVNPMFPGFNQTTYNELQKGYPGEARGPWYNLVHKPQP